MQGVVVGDKQDKTVVVKVERRFTHPVMKKTVRKTKNYHAHDENNTAKVGDTVFIEESRPLSKLKTWCSSTSEGLKALPRGCLTRAARATAALSTYEGRDNRSPSGVVRGAILPWPETCLKQRKGSKP